MGGTKSMIVQKLKRKYVTHNRPNAEKENGNSKLFVRTPLLPVSERLLKKMLLRQFQEENTEDMNTDMFQNLKTRPIMKQKTMFIRRKLLPSTVYVR